jgi:hypothetical protein
MTDRAVVGQRVARLPFLAGDGGASPTPRLHFSSATVAEVNPLLATDHYLGPIASGVHCFAGWVDDELVACQVYRQPTARRLNGLGYLELSRWCLTADAGKNAGSKMMGWAVRELRRTTTEGALISHSDLSKHSGSLYRASGWEPWATHHADRFLADGIGYASGHGSWNGRDVQAPKMRWRYPLRPKDRKDR